MCATSPLPAPPRHAALPRSAPPSTTAPPRASPARPTLLTVAPRECPCSQVALDLVAMLELLREADAAGVAVEAVERGQAKLEQADKAQVWEGAREARMLACSTPAPPECTPTTAFISITASCVSHDHTVCAGRGPAVALRGCRRGAR